MIHTKEPWKKGREISIDNGALATEINGDRWLGLARVITRMSVADEYNDEGIANLERIIACVNAMEGIENPKEFVELSKAHYEDVMRWEQTMMQHLGEDGVGSVVDAINKMKAEINTLKAKRPEQLITLTKTDRDNLCDIVWWIRGYKKGADNSFNDCPFEQDHLDTLDKTVRVLREVLNQKK